MKALGIWLVAWAIVFGAIGAGYHMVRQSSPNRIFVVVDSSFAMDPVWRDVTGILDDLDNEQYTEFALATDKGPEHGWQGELELSPGLSPWAPRDLSGITAHPEIDEAAELILITNADASETAGLTGWRIIRIDR